MLSLPHVSIAAYLASSLPSTSSYHLRVLSFCLAPPVSIVFTLCSPRSLLIFNPMQSICVVIRGTMSLSDCVTDGLAKPCSFILPGFGHTFTHEGILTVSANHYENDKNYSYGYHCYCFSGNCLYSDDCYYFSLVFFIMRLIGYASLYSCVTDGLAKACAFMLAGFL